MGVADNKSVTMLRRSRGLLLGALLCLPVGAATLERLSLDDVITKSTAIVRGKILSSYSAFRGPMIYTYYRVQVLEQWKGAPALEVDVAVPGGKASGYEQVFSGAPALVAGSECVMFLWTGRAGLTQVIGLSQGLFDVKRTDRGDVVAVRPGTTELLLDPNTRQPVSDQAVALRLVELKQRIVRTLAAGGSR
jgi:hypothetical protein